MDTKLENMSQEVCLKGRQEKCENSQPCFENVQSTDTYMEIEIEDTEDQLGNDDLQLQKIENLHRKIDTGLQKIMQREKDKQKFENDELCFENVDYKAVSNFQDVDNHHHNMEATKVGTNNGDLQSFTKKDNVFIFENPDSKCQDEDEEDYGKCVEIINIKQETELHQQPMSESHIKENPKLVKVVKKETKFDDNEFINKSENIDLQPGTIQVENSSASVELNCFKPENEMTITEKNHLRKDTTTPGMFQQHQCNTCGKVLMSAHGLRRHLKITHSTERPHQCYMCDKAFKTVKCLRCHMVSHSTERPHQCGVCDERFKSLKTLKKHMITHSSERPYLCSMCEKDFKTKKNLKQHMISHSSERPYPCSMCDKAFKAWKYLKEHLVTHSPEQSYKCDECDKVFNRMPDLRKHKVTHRTERPHQCHMCNKEFKRLRGLREHVQSHSTERPHQCKACDKAFKTVKNLRRHVIVCHSTDQPE